MKLFICQVYLRGVATGEGEDIVDAPEIWEWHINKCIDLNSMNCKWRLNSCIISGYIIPGVPKKRKGGFSVLCNSIMSNVWVSWDEIFCTKKNDTNIVLIVWEIFGYFLKHNNFLISLNFASSRSRKLASVVVQTLGKGSPLWAVGHWSVQTEQRMYG